MPVTYAAENEVPDVIWYFSSGAGRKDVRAGRRQRDMAAAVEAANSLSCASVPLYRDHIGIGGRIKRGDFGPALPAAAIISTPRSAVAMMPRSINGSFGPAKLMLTICAPCRTA